MKNVIKPLNISSISAFRLGLLLILALAGCNKDKMDPPAEENDPIGVNFDDDQTIAENSGENEFSILFDELAFQSGTLKLKVTTDFKTAFQTKPEIKNDFIDIAVEKGDVSASLFITPVDNNEIEENRIVNFELVSVSEGFSIGAKSSLMITIFDEEMPAPTPAVNFSESSGIVLENAAEAALVTVQLSEPTPLEGKVIIELGGLSGEAFFTTQPALSSNNRLELVIPSNTIEASFRLIPTDDNLLKGHQTAMFSIVETKGGLIKGELLSYRLTLLDDELVSKPKSFETTGGGWRSKKTYSYNESGAIQSIYWETETPNLRTGTDTYYYAANGLVNRVNRFPNLDEYYYQENGKIVRSEEIENGIKTSYSEYDYDAAGNVGAKAIYYRQSSGAFQLGFIYLYLYDTDGNIYVQQTYIPQTGPDDLLLISTRTYEGYVDASNPFPIEIIPGIAAQQTLPTTYRVEENGHTLQYQFSYGFREDGLPISRNTSGAGTEATLYQYY